MNSVVSSKKIMHLSSNRRVFLKETEATISLLFLSMILCKREDGVIVFEATDREKYCYINRLESILNDLSILSSNGFMKHTGRKMMTNINLYDEWIQIVRMKKAVIRQIEMARHSV